MKPSIGRVVISQVDAPVFNNGADTCPAVITRVWGERPQGGWAVNVRQLRDANAGANEWKTSCVLFETEGEARAYGVGGLFWPPRVSA